MNELKIDLVAQVDDDSHSIDGDQLWKVTSFLSQNPDGSGPEEVLDEQVLTPEQQGEGLDPDVPLDFGVVDVNLDMEDRNCEEAQYLCLRLSKNERASAEFTFQTEPDESVVTECMDLNPEENCHGKECFFFFFFYVRAKLLSFKNEIMVMLIRSVEV